MENIISVLNQLGNIGFLKNFIDALVLLVLKKNIKNFTIKYNPSGRYKFLYF